MAEIILAPTAQSKVIPLSIRLNDTDASLVSQLVTNRQFSTADTDAWFSFTLEGLAATTGTFDLTLINLHDKSVFNHTDKVFNTNPFYYKLDSGTDELTNEIRHAGKWVGQLVVTLANGDSATRKFIFGIEGHILDGTVVQTILLEDYNALIASIESAKDELTQYNIDYASLIGTVTEQEAARLDAEELRVIADALRETKEGIRQATFEANEVIRDGVVDSAIEGEMISQTVTTKLTEKEATYAPRLVSVEQQLADTETGKLEFVKRLAAGEVTKIKIIGDSVSAGVRVADYNVSPTARIILTGSRFNDGGTGYAREADTTWTTLPSWSNLFRKYIATNYTGIEFVNNGIAGLSTDEAVDNYISQLVDENEDVVFVMLGLNDRYTDLANYKTNMRTLLDYIKDRSNQIILMSPPPALTDWLNMDQTQGRSADMFFGSNEINNTLVELSKEYGVPLISHYSKFPYHATALNVKYYNASEPDYGLSFDGTHPSTIGSGAMWKTIQQELCLSGQPTEFDNAYSPVYVDTGYNKVTSTTPLTAYPLRQVAYHVISGANKTGFPDSEQGVLTTVRPGRDTLDAWAYQIYTKQGAGSLYKRYWTGSAWSEWMEQLTAYKGQAIFPISAVTTQPANHPETSYPEKSITHEVISSAHVELVSFPEGKEGLLVTVNHRYTFGRWAYQEYHVYGSHNIYKRYWASGSMWSAWKRVSGNLSLTTTARTTLATKKGMVAGDMIFDTTLNKPVWYTGSGWVDATGTAV